ncbi:MAG TPA: hypothetical protein VGM03_13660 [Phycisphaerae bacterium]
MESLATFVVHVADLVEAEGRAMHAATLRLLTAAAVLLIAASAGIGGATLVLLAVYRTLEPMSATLAAALTGLLALAIGGLLAWLARRVAR